MITLIEKLNINKNTSTSNSNSALVSEVQNEYDDINAYQTFSWQNGAKKYKNGYLASNCDDEYFAVIAFNPDETNSDQDALFWDYGLDFEDIEMLKPGQSRSGKKGSSVTRLW